MKKYAILCLLFASSCVNFDHVSCLPPSDYDRNTAESYYSSWGSRMVDDATYNRVKKKFTCNYMPSDYIYSYETFLDTKYILVRRGRAITYIEE